MMDNKYSTRKLELTRASIDSKMSEENIPIDVEIKNAAPRAIVAFLGI